jgi:protein tyrosine phosphatase (PTP) superfamily phosphohydrolase (DUF442 family)
MARSNNYLDFSQITDQLYIGVTPKKNEYPFLRDLGIRLIINMRAETVLRKPPETEEITEIRVPTLDNFLFPIRHTTLVHPVELASEAIENGDKVYVFCRKGRHRSVAMGAAILISQGSSLIDSTRLLEEQRPVADTRAKHIHNAIVEFDNYWNDELLKA